MAKEDSTLEKMDEKRQQIAAAKALISSIKAASSREEVALLIGACRALIEQCPPSIKGSLQSTLSAVAENAESKIQTGYIRRLDDQRDAAEAAAAAAAAPIAKEDDVPLTSKSSEELAKISKPMSENKLNILSAAILAATETGKDIKDTAFGNALAAIEEHERKEEHREASKSRVSLLKDLGASLADTGEIPDALIEQAKDLKIDLKLEDGKPSEKTLKAVANISKLDMTEVESKRTERAAPTQDAIEQTKEGETLGLNNLFGDNDFEDNSHAAPSLKKASPKEKPAFDVEAARQAGAATRAQRQAANEENNKAVEEVGYLAQSDLFKETTLLDKLVTNTTRPAKTEQAYNADLSVLSHTSERPADGVKVKTFEDPKTKVVLTQTKNGNFRDVDINVEKGPALVAVAMQHENGAKAKDSKFVVEFDQNGNAIKTAPDLSLVETDKEKNLAYLEVDGKRMVLPMSAERVEALRQQIQQYGPEVAVEGKAASGTSRTTAEETPSPDPRLAEISKKQPHEKTAEEIKLEYSAMSKEHMQLLVEGKLAGDIHNADQYAQKMRDYEALHLSSKTPEGSLIPEEQIRQNQASMEKAREIGQIQYQAEVKQELTTAFKNQAEAVASYDGASLTQAESHERLAKEKLAAAGLTPDSIKSAEKEALSTAASKSMESALEKEMQGKDPIIEAKEQQFLRKKMSSNGMTREEVKEKELDATIQAANSLGSRLRQQKEGAPPEDQKKIDEQIGKLEKIANPRIEVLRAPSKADKIVEEVKSRSSNAIPRAPVHKEKDRSQSQSAGTGRAIG